MVSRCANPECAVPFLYLHQGKLFRVEAGNDRDRSRQERNTSRRVEFYWLCRSCAATMTLVVDQGGSVAVRPRQGTQANVAA